MERSDIEELLTRSVAEILPTKAELENILLSDKKLRIYIGTDATGTSLHLGHATNYMILERFRRLGHEVIFLVGDFTSRIGDPTDKGDAARKQLTRDQVVLNTKTWMDQIRPVIDIDNKDNPVKVLYNHEWLAALKLEDVLDLASNFTVQQMIERDMFEKRIEEGKPLYLHELFYPLMQGYDSVAMEVDMEMCGRDQKFNALAGRTLLKKLKNKEKFVFITKLLENPLTGEKMMSKSLGTGVFLDFDSNTMYGAIMAQPDENMHQLFVDCTWLTLDQIENILSADNPRDAKMRLSKEIVSIYHGVESAEKAEENFINTFSKKGIPSDVPTIKIPKGSKIMPAVLEAGLVESNTEWRRLVDEGAVSHADTGEVILSTNETVEVPLILKIGKRRFIKIEIL
jgi:tyrosyl-tRNA synthetase